MRQAVHHNLYLIIYFLNVVTPMFNSLKFSLIHVRLNSCVAARSAEKLVCGMFQIHSEKRLYKTTTSIVLLVLPLWVSVEDVNKENMCFQMKLNLIFR